MKIQLLNQLNFGYKSILKTAYQQGLLPTVTKDFYGSPLSKDTVTLDHLLPKSKNGTSKLSNFVLATMKNNSTRGNKPLSNVFNQEAFEQYCEQFKGVKIPFFNGDEYIKQISKTVEKLLKQGK